jgi:hypothetical protein
MKKNRFQELFDEIKKNSTPLNERPPMPCVACDGDCGMCGGPMQMDIQRIGNNYFRREMIWLNGVGWVRQHKPIGNSPITG